MRVIVFKFCANAAISKIPPSYNAFKCMSDLRRYCGPCFSGRLAFSHSLCLKTTYGKTDRRKFSRICSIVDDEGNLDNSDDEEKESLDDKTKRVCMRNL